jgi:hypothetical protein
MGVNGAHDVEEKESGSPPHRESMFLLRRRREMDDIQSASEWNVIQWCLEGHLAIEFIKGSRYDKMTVVMMMKQVF